ncbi:putative sir2 family histone [Phaeomoniella chlamydospora]|uniref:Putative sir2 family histone n=1 Tax=Phaeomoniella chlamydospora TaxID=158046 RepID=A0A0G2ENP4_PHACM|nr:putative sir2 family histone [Phaeomoniella chlamydospora]
MSDPTPLTPADQNTATQSIMLSAADLQSFRAHLKSSTRIFALLGAGLSASSGLPTFRGAGGLWRSHDATSLATPHAFQADPGLVWQFYSYRRNMAKHANPNAAHFALAELAKKLNHGCPPGQEKFLCLSQNVDGLSQRAGHTEETGLRLLHGSLWDVKCFDRRCDFVRKNDFEDPICPSLAMPATNNGLNPGTPSDISNPLIDLPPVPYSSLPHCPKCHHSLLRPGVVWFTESLPTQTLGSISSWLDTTLPDEYSPHVDLMLVIGTSSVVYPAAGYTDMARDLGARIAVVNLDAGSEELVGLRKGVDWMFRGDAAMVVPELVKEVIGDM